MMFDYEKDLNFFDNAIPFEKDIYIDMLIARMKDGPTQRTASYTDGNLPRREEFE